MEGSSGMLEDAEVVELRRADVRVDSVDFKEKADARDAGGAGASAGGFSGESVGVGRRSPEPMAPRGDGERDRESTGNVLSFAERLIAVIELSVIRLACDARSEGSPLQHSFITISSFR